MGYSIVIGEAEVVTDPDEYFAEYQVKEILPYDIATIHPNSLDKVYAKGNKMYIGYILYHAWLKEVGLEGVLSSKDLEEEAKALIKITPMMLILVRVRIKKHKEEYPESLPILNEKGLTSNGILARLVWFEYWMDWALRNSDLPTISFY
jgi:hypothetical protein